MAEVVNVIVALAVIIFVFRWVTNMSEDTSPEAAVARALKFKPKKVTNDMTDQICSMFPDIPRENVHYDLLRTGSVEKTTEKILERGYLDAPPQAYFTIYPRNPTATATTNQPRRPPAGPAAASSSAAGSSSSRKPSETLISRFQLEQRAKEQEQAASINPAATATDASVGEGESDAGGKATWEDTAEKRERSLRERKEKMILAARQRIIAQQQQKQQEGKAS